LSNLNIQYGPQEKERTEERKGKRKEGRKKTTGENNEQKERACPMLIISSIH